jgi:hypothetical protein
LYLWISGKSIHGMELKHLEPLLMINKGFNPSKLEDTMLELIAVEVDHGTIKRSPYHSKFLTIKILLNLCLKIVWMKVLITKVGEFLTCKYVLSHVRVIVKKLNLRVLGTTMVLILPKPVNVEMLKC